MEYLKPVFFEQIWNHPDILHYFLKKRAGEEDIDLDLDETVPIGTPASDSSSPMTPSTPPQILASKRGRTPRKVKDKPPRKVSFFEIYFRIIILSDANISVNTFWFKNKKSNSCTNNRLDSLFRLLINIISIDLT